ncbi:zinc uptake transcriptional repressor Zur [Orbaceae bacterium ac157xtp]
MKLPAHKQAILDAIEKTCLQRKINLTHQRKIVLTIMLNAEKAMSAYELLDLLKIEESQAKPPTIYRVLTFLLSQGFIHKVESSNSFILCPHFSRPNHISILFICDSCQQITEQHDEVLEEHLLNLSQKNQFNTKHSIIEIHGFCHLCQS